MSDCTHDCSTCSSSCESKPDPQSLIEDPNPNSSIKRLIGIVSGKGGVGKSLVTELLAVATAKSGKHAAILDADITGPSIPKAFGITAKATGNSEGIFPVRTKTGIDIMSINLLLENTTDPVVWRGPVIAGTVKQFWTDVIWNNVDTLFVDMPPGTGDVPLTVFQSIPLDGIIVVTTPQDLVSMIVAKAVKMARLMNIPIIGIIENMSYVKCPDCGEKINIFGKSHIDEICKEFNIPLLASIPIDPALASAVDSGSVEDYNTDFMQAAIDLIG